MEFGDKHTSWFAMTPTVAGAAVGLGVFKLQWTRYAPMQRAFVCCLYRYNALTFNRFSPSNVLPGIDADNERCGFLLFFNCCVLLFPCSCVLPYCVIARYLLLLRPLSRLTLYCRVVVTPTLIPPVKVRREPFSASVTHPNRGERFGWTTSIGPHSHVFSPLCPTLFATISLGVLSYCRLRFYAVHPCS